MSHDKIGPKEMMLRQMRAEREHRSKPSRDDLRAKVAAIPPESPKRAAKKVSKKKGFKQ